MRLLEHQTFVVTGATGFLGSAFVRFALGRGAGVHIIARQGTDHRRLREVKDRYATTIGALTDLATIDLTLPRVDAFVHFAAAGVNQRFDDVAELVNTNVVGTLRALELAHRLKATKFVLIGTSAEYGAGELLGEDHALCPTSEYGATRASASLLARAFGARRGLDVVIVRPFSVYGPFEASYRLIPYAVTQGLAGAPIRISSGHQVRDYVFVDDVADGIARACICETVSGEAINLCSGTTMSVRDAVTTVARLTGDRSLIETDAMEAIPGEMWRTSGDPARAHSVLGWSATTSMADGLARTIEWTKRQGANG